MRFRQDRSPPTLRPHWVGAYLLSGLIGGCSRFETFELPSLPAHAHSNYQEKEGLTLAAQMLSSTLTSKYHFGPDLRREGFLPVFVSIENRGDTSFEILRKNLSVVLESGERLEPVSPQEIFAQVRRSTLPALIFAPLVVPAILLHRHIEDYNYYAAQTLFEKSLPASLRIEKSDPPLTRAVFFRDPEGKLRSQRSLSSTVLYALVDIEGTRPTESGGDTNGPAGDDKAERPRTDGGATEPARHSGPPSSRVGRSLSFTVSLGSEDL